MAIAMAWHKPDNVTGSSAPAIMVGLFVASGGILFGYDTGAINGILAMRAFKDQFDTHCDAKSKSLDICTNDTAILVAILSAGTAFGSLLAAPASVSFGRRITMLIAVGIFCAGAICQVCAQSMPLMLFGRVLAGVGVGAISVLVPIYQSEMAPSWIRGTLIYTYQLSITISLIAASIINAITFNIEGSAAYSIPLSLQFLPALVLTSGILILLETPQFLIIQLRRLDITHPALVEELEEIQANHQYELSLGSNDYKELSYSSPHLSRRTFTSCFIQMLQQLTGINFIMYYSTAFFRGAGSRALILSH
ncbi:unnamed protein product [Clonostachys rosea]|uniref:Major facilitator superfamily (MFS) profile domain-containing protein n=1 Tax=Bionectria ochroleuca TaxID=29856 RepID=A0ABY6UYU4_BIOOC|nr:unnamed protein product [Clonostachys rosea]